MPKKTTSEAQALVAVDDSVVVQLPTPEQGAIAVRNYTELKNMLDKELEDCVVMVNTRNGMKPFRKKTYWRAIGNCFKLSYEIIRDERIELDGDWGYEVTVRATDLDGRFSDGDGSCFASEKTGLGSKVHDVRAHAKTRATNRAIADLVAFGEVSFEEVAEYKPNNLKEKATAKQSAVENSQAELNKAFKKTKPVEPEKTLDDFDGDETVTGVNYKKTLDNGTDVWTVQTNLRKYTCLKKDVWELAEKAMAEELTVSTDYEEKMYGKFPFNALNGISLNYT